MTQYLVERELSWVLDSPQFYSPSALMYAMSQTEFYTTVSLPGPVQFPNDFEFPDAPAIAQLLPDARQRQECAERVAHELLDFHSGRLGLLFEKYLENILKYKFGTENVLTRVAVRESHQGGRGVKTWGEFDFLIFNQMKDRIEHWESSIKFYLQVDDRDHWNACWGPGVRDRLDLKGAKTFLQQLPLSSTQLGHAAIPPSWSPYPLVKNVYAKGTIFYFWDPEQMTFDSRLKSIVPPAGLAQGHLKSWWIRPESLASLKEQAPDVLLSVIPRRYWMTGIPDSDLESALERWDEFERSLDDRLTALAARQECLLVGLHKDAYPHPLQQMGFIASPHFLGALAATGVATPR